jgi:nucleoid DNA-binding protein
MRRTSVISIVPSMHGSVLTWLASFRRVTPDVFKRVTEGREGRHMAKGAIQSPMSKSQVLSEVAASTELSRKQVAGVLDEITGLIKRHIGKKGPGSFTLPGLFKVTTVRKKAVPARKGINPFTKEETTFKAKPARTVIKIRALKKMKDMV